MRHAARAAARQETHDRFQYEFEESKDPGISTSLNSQLFSRQALTAEFIRGQARISLNEAQRRARQYQG